MNRTLIAAAGFAAVLGVSAPAWAHCDTLGGPVVADARAALESGDVTPVLKWVKAADETEVRGAFLRARAVRGLSTAARDLADRYFFDTAVRLHRASEGEPFTGVKDVAADPIVASLDRALDTGDVDAFVADLAHRADAGLRDRLVRVHALRGDAGASVDAGRRYVAAYVDLIRYIERLEGTGAES